MKNLLKQDRDMMAHIMTHKNRFKGKSMIENDIVEYNCSYGLKTNKKKRAYKFPNGAK